MQARALPVAQGGDTCIKHYETAVKETGAEKMLCNKVQKKMVCKKGWEQCLRKWPRKKSFKGKGNAGRGGVTVKLPDPIACACDVCGLKDE